jgi:hypothetical protein
MAPALLTSLEQLRYRKVSVGLLEVSLTSQKSPPQAWVFKGRLPGFATIGFGG